MITINASDIQCRADEAVASVFEFQDPRVKTRVAVRSHDRQLAESAAKEYFQIPDRGRDSGQDVELF